jgi:hypothetical protein
MVALVAGASPATAAAVPSLGWSAPTALPSSGAPSAVSCATEALCVAVDSAGEALSTLDPTASTPYWSRAAIDPGRPLNAVSCAPAGTCVAVDGHGSAFVSLRPGSSSWSQASIDGATALTGVSCPSASLCVAVDESGNVLMSTAPGSGGWTAPLPIDPGHHLRAVSCSSQSLCVAVDDAGQALSSVNPAGGKGAWRAQRIDFGEPLAVSCSVAGECVAIDASGDALSSADPGAAPATWSLTPIDGERLTGVSCASSGLCVAVDVRGEALASDDPAVATPAWSESSANSGQSLAGVSCLPGGFCLVLDRAGGTGRSLSARVPAPRATTLTATEVTSTSATLAGAVDPNDAVLDECRFEYGTAVAGGSGAGRSYAQSVPCSALPALIGGAQSVSAQLSGLSPNTVYHYRVLASSPAGATAGADVALTTGTSSQVALVYPRPSLTGTPAAGQRLTCHPGTPADTPARLGYAWLRDLIPIPGNTGSTYTVKYQDSAHHLQCQVTATDGGGSATAKSAFVTIPVGGAPASVGETLVGKAAFRSGRLSVPIVCSPHASGGCQIALRLTVAETLNGKHIVAIAARWKPSARKSAAALRHTTVTLASARVHLAAGARTTVTAALNATGRRLLASVRHLSAYLYVSGTVIGVIESQLGRQIVALGASSRRAAMAPARRAAAHPRAPSAGVGAGVGGGRRASTPAAGITAATPYMGWDTYFALGGNYSEATILTQASRLISLGLQRRGYRYVWLDVGWWHGTRDATGQITVSPTQWPHGLAWLTRTLHAVGLRVGIYTDAGPDGCGGGGQGSYSRYQQDANTFASWGFDALKVDFCGGAEHQRNPAGAYSAFHAAIVANSSHRPMLLSICNFLQPEQYSESQPALEESVFSSYTFGPGVGNSWRTDTDVGVPGHVSFKDVLRNMDADAAAPQAAGPGHWNDPDYLAPDQGMSATQFRSQLSMWAMLEAPLMISDDLTRISPASLAAVQNTEVTAIDQDPGAVQGTLLSSYGNGQVWVKPLIDGSRAVALLNRGTSPARIATSASAIGMPPTSSYKLLDVWTHRTSFTHGSIGAAVPGDGTVLLRVTAR